jgi:hypothetical protein
MKKTKTMLGALAIAAAFDVTQAANAALSPRAQSSAADLRRVSGVTPDMLDRSVKTGSPKALALAQDFRHAPGVQADMLDREVRVGSPRARANEQWQSPAPRK